MPAEPFAALTLARVVRPWGRHGQVAAEILTDFPEHLTVLRRAWLADQRGARHEVSVVSCRLPTRAGGQAIFQFEDVTSIEEAEKLRNCEIQVPLSERLSLPSGRYYISDLTGCAVWEEGAAAPLGTVREVQPLAERAELPESWLLSVATCGGGELLIPLAAEICIAVDVAARRILVRLPEGLQELNR